jgi:hypothetical protein
VYLKVTTPTGYLGVSLVVAGGGLILRTFHLLFLSITRSEGKPCGIATSKDPQCIEGMYLLVSGELAIAIIVLGVSVSLVQSTKVITKGTLILSLRGMRGTTIGETNE